MTERVSWDDIKARQAETDSRTPTQRDASRAASSLRFDLAQLVYDLRTGAGLTQRQLADRMGTTQSVISRLEQAGRLPTLDLLARVAAATESDLRLLVRRAGGNDLDVPLSA
jgi:ribosome-binding protein aMBF1 (putative translation factor)